MTPTPDQVADLLDDAADLIERDGWAQGWLRDPDGRLCPGGAIVVADVAGSQILACRSPLVQAGLSAARDTIGGALTGWNDAEGRTEQQVLDMLRTTAKRQRIAADQAGGTP